MKAYVYLVCVGGTWSAQMTIAPEVDRLFWMEEGLAEAAVVLDVRLGRIGNKERGQRDAVEKRLNGERAEEGWIWDEPLPLGDAVRCVELWDLAAGSVAGSAVGPLASLAACVEQARREAGAPRGPGKQSARPWARAAADAGGSSPGAARAATRAREAMAAAALRAAAALQGRALLRSEAHALLGSAAADTGGALQLAQLLGWLRLAGAVAAEHGRRRRECRCRRCGSGEARMHRTACAACGRMCAYCSACLAMGRSRECELLVLGMPAPSLPAGSTSADLHKWQLSPAQAAATESALRFIEAPYQPQSQREFLLWAVTGAGKTEMIFPLVESVLLRGGRALIATPRRDVVIELDPRIRRAFPKARVVTLYGGSEQRWEEGEITLATTHQLMRFHQAFDLVIIDELDAFPYHGDPMLHYAAEKSRAPHAPKLLLSATPPAELQRRARSGQLPHARVPVRYHRHPLPVPALLRTPSAAKLLQAGKLPRALLAALNRSLTRGAQLFVFVQRISQVEPMAKLLSLLLKQPAVEGTSSQDPLRADKVSRFRKSEIRVLVTTTILERGVTIPRSDVYILDADGRLFDEASLVQMAGRAGRSGDDPNGFVYFCGRERTRSQLSAVSQIRGMNRIAGKQGYLLQEGPNVRSFWRRWLNR
ncbi:DEAD/DEAH box helicase family protein [Paenibacillus glycanilyticus]|uniref:DEAD/DEAH box helicase n=1 Tax=Paenibacillus glycanilyticus TaxID=126569 RepID=UPI00203EBB10|nr:helicase-related protein [Paenibacillus glycanilyticus]MCM3628102.1 DEAD/DEAH box helicase family protein [Paenibacillus glycanilyticus]